MAVAAHAMGIRERKPRAGHWSADFAAAPRATATRAAPEMLMAGFPITPDPTPPAPGIPQPVDTGAFPAGCIPPPGVPDTGEGEVACTNLIYFPMFTPPFPPPNVGSVDIPGPLTIAPAPVPPSLAGVVQPQFRTGSAAAPSAASWFPQFTTIFPVPTVVFANIFVQGATLPPMTATTQNVEMGGWGPGAGPQTPTPESPWDIPTLEDEESEGDFMTRCIAALEGQGAEEEEATTVCEQAYIDQTEVAGHVGAVHHGDEGTAERPARSVLQRGDHHPVRKPKPPKGRRR
jgi:hypothetical protein